MLVPSFYEAGCCCIYRSMRYMRKLSIRLAASISSSRLPTYEPFFMPFRFS